MTRLSAASLHGTTIADRMSPEERAALGIKGASEISAHAERSDERELQRLCEGLLRLRGIPYMHIPSTAKHSAGWPDLTFALRGRFVAVELKAKSGKLSAEQVATLDGLNRHGAATAVVRTFDDFRTLLDVIPAATLANEAGLVSKTCAGMGEAVGRVESKPMVNMDAVMAAMIELDKQDTDRQTMPTGPIDESEKMP